MVCFLSAGCAVAPDRDEARAGVALLRLRPAFAAPVSLRVAASDRLAAYSWDDGRIVVTRGLVDSLTDDELAAAIAHEMGHLCLARAGQPARPPFALRGNRGDDEHRADLEALRLLQSSGIPLAALARALGRVRDSPLTPGSLKEGLWLRIAALRAAGK